MYTDAEEEEKIFVRCTKKKSIVFEIDAIGAIQAEYLRDYKCIAKIEFKNADEVADFIYGQLKNDYEKLLSRVRKLKKAVKIYELMREADMLKRGRLDEGDVE